MPLTRLASSTIFLASMLVLACGSGDKARPPLGDATGNGGAGGDSSSAGCKDGDTAECKVVIHQASGVTSCWIGERVCVDGAWTDCAVAQ